MTSEVKKKVLIIEDNLISSTALEMMVISNGFESAGRFDSADNLSGICKENKPDLILLDIMLAGELNGLEAARELRKEMDTPILFITALSDSDSTKAIKAIKNSAATFKPYIEDSILTKIQDMLK
ncbi:MAG: response regulator [Cyclobacteriaceae bacterium]|nr:response regulator [Cyclobacteriaceae bacterium SS2]